MKYSVIIPARYASTRLPAKPLAIIDGKSMIQHVYQRAEQSGAEKVIVATDDQRVFDAVTAFSGEVCMTSADHQSGTDRLQEVVKLYGLADDEIIVNVQGDEPLIPPTVIRQVAKNLAENSRASAATLGEPIHDLETLFNPNAVKVVADNMGRALYFSRAPIPWQRDEFSPTQIQEIFDGDFDATKAAVAGSPVNISSLARRHIGIYAYRVAVLHEFVTWPLAPLESIEKLEQLRLLANGREIHIADACEPVPGGVDTEADLERLRAIIEGAK